MRFHLIDRIDSAAPGQRIAARKVPSSSEEFWRAGPGGPVMPAVLVLETLCQAGTWLVLLSTDHRRRAALLSVGQVGFHGDVRPGEVLLLAGEVVSWSEEVAVLDGTATVAGSTGNPDRLVLSASGIMCALIDAERLGDPAATPRVAAQLSGTGAAQPAPAGPPAPRAPLAGAGGARGGGGPVPRVGRGARGAAPRPPPWARLAT